MKFITSTLLSGCLALAVGGAFAQGSAAKGDSMAKDSTTKIEMTMQQCNDYMATHEGGMKNENDSAMTKKNDTMAKKNQMCSDMMKEYGAKRGQEEFGPNVKPSK